MGQRLSESRDAAGRTTIELQDEPPKVLLLCCVLSLAPFLVYGWAALYFTLAMLFVFGSLSTWFTVARRRMRVTVDVAARTLAVESGPKPRVLALDEVRAARIAGGEGRPGNQRVELVLRSGETLPLYVGLGGFREADCRSLADRVQGLLPLSQS